MTIIKPLMNNCEKHKMAFVPTENPDQYSLLIWPVTSEDDDNIRCCYCGDIKSPGIIEGPHYIYEGVQLQWVACLGRCTTIVYKLIWNKTPWWARNEYLDGMIRVWHAKNALMKGTQ